MLPLLVFFTSSVFLIENLGFFECGPILEMCVVLGLLSLPFNNTVVSQA